MVFELKSSVARRVGHGDAKTVSCGGAATARPTARSSVSSMMATTHRSNAAQSPAASQCFKMQYLQVPFFLHTIHHSDSIAVCRQHYEHSGWTTPVGSL